MVSEAAAGRPVRWLAIESAQEAAVLAGLAGERASAVGGLPAAGRPAPPQPGGGAGDQARVRGRRAASKFGASYQEILALVQGASLAGPGLRLRGIHVHVGSDLSDVQAFCSAGVRAARLLAACGSTCRGTAAGWTRSISAADSRCPRAGAPGPESVP